MSREFIDAIASGNNLEAEDEFNNSISSKVGDALEVRRKELSQNFVGNNEVDEESDLDEAGWENLAKALEPGGRLSKEKDTGKGWQNLNKVLAKKDTGKGWQNLNKVLAKKDEKPKAEKPYPKIGAEEPPRKKPPFDIPPVVAEPSVGAKPPRRSPGALGGRIKPSAYTQDAPPTKPRPGIKPPSQLEKEKPPRRSPGALGGKTPKPKTPKHPRRSPGALGGKRDEYDDTYGGP